jgi:hypothetical protein
MRRWLIGICALAASVDALATLTETPKAAPECEWGASSVSVDERGVVDGPYASGCR